MQARLLCSKMFLVNLACELSWQPPVRIPRGSAQLSGPCLTLVPRPNPRLDQCRKFMEAQGISRKIRLFKLFRPTNSMEFGYDGQTAKSPLQAFPRESRKRSLIPPAKFEMENSSP